MAAGIYIHIPFCKKKCNYCDFVSYSGKEDLIDAYVGALLQELEQLSLTAYYLPPTTCYIGGGTPTLLNPKHFDKIISTSIGNLTLEIARLSDGQRHFELSIEANPGTVSHEYLKELRRLGINRLSIGAQSFSGRHLKTLGRIHGARQIIEAFEAARKAGFDNINLDLIFAIPSQTLSEWKKDLGTALSLHPEHLSVYNLQIEEGTPLWELSKHKIQDEDAAADMYEYAMDFLGEIGYRHYEISNFAKPGCECRHNINYWQNGNYLGIGAGAHSHIGGKRWKNTTSIEEYMKQRGQGSGIGEEGAGDTEECDPKIEKIIMGLRLVEGIDTDNFIGFEKEISELSSQRLVEQVNGKTKLSRKGIMLGNLVFEKFVSSPRNY